MVSELAMAAGLVEIDDAEPWRQYANCRGRNSDLFFPERGETARIAKGICYECMVREECLDWAISTYQRHGIWGGMSEKERVRERSRRRREGIAVSGRRTG